MFLDRLQSGFLLLQTRQGKVRVEVSPRQRIYLLWTFRNFRHLSIPLLNSRQVALINSLFPGAVPCERYDPALVIGVVDNYLPPPPAAPSPQEEGVTTPHAAVAPKPGPVLLPSPKVARPQATNRIAAARLATPRFAAAMGALSLGVISVVAWHRIQGIPVSRLTIALPFSRSTPRSGQMLNPQNVRPFSWRNLRLSRAPAEASNRSPLLRRPLHLEPPWELPTGQSLFVASRRIGSRGEHGNRRQPLRRCESTGP